MSGFDPNALANATASTGGDDSEPPPVGTYEVVVDNAEAFQSKAGNDIVKFELRVAAGDLYGHQWTEIFGFKTQKSYDFFKGVCERMRIDLEGVTGLDVLDQRVKATVGQWFVVDVVASRNPEFPKNSVFFKDGGPITAGQSTDAPVDTSEFQTASTQPGADDDIPF